MFAGQSKTSILVDRKIKVYAFHFEGSPDMTEVDLEVSENNQASAVKP